MSESRVLSALSEMYEPAPGMPEKFADTQLGKRLHHSMSGDQDE